MALPTGANTSTTLGGATFNLDMVPVYIKKKLLEILKKKVVFHQLGDHESLPKGQGKTVRFVRYERFGLPLDTLPEGETPTEYRQLVVNAIEAVVDQWGDVGLITDVAELTVFHKALQIMIDRFATQASEVADREDQRVLMASSNVVFPDPTVVTDRTALTVNHFVDTDTIRRVLAAMRYDGVPDFGGDFVGVFDPFVELDLTKDPTFQAASLYGNQTGLMYGEVGRWMGVRWMRSNHIPYIVRNVAQVAPTNSTQVADASEVALPLPAPNNGYTVQVVGLDASGFETQVGIENVPAGFVAGRIVQVILVAPVAPVVAYNIYIKDTNSAAQPTLVASAVKAGTYRIHNGTSTAVVGATSVTYSTLGAAAPLVPAVGVKVHQTYIFGREAFGVIDLTNIETTLTPPVASDSDPLKQRRKAGWKYMYKAIVKNPLFFRRIESESFFD